MIRLVTFDLDGTAADTIHTIRRFVNEVLSDAGFGTVPAERMTSYVGGGGLLMFQKISADLGFPAVEAPRLFEDWKKRYGDAYAEGTTAFEGIPALLCRLRAGGIHTAILTNKAQPIAEGISRRLFGDTVEAVCGDAPGVPLKPDPAALLGLCSRFGVLPQDCLHVGDSRADITAALRAGAHACAVSWGYLGIDELMALSPEFRADTAEDIETAVRSLR